MKVFTVLFLSILLSATSCFAQQQEGSKDEKFHHFNLGLNFSRLSPLPYLSMNYQMNKRLGFTGEIKPVFLLSNRLGWEIFDDVTGHNSGKLKYNGFLTNFIVHFTFYRYRKINFSAGGEFSFQQIFEKNYTVVYKGQNLCDPHEVISTYIDIRTRYGFIPLIFIGDSFIKFFAGYGIARFDLYDRGYSYTKPYSGSGEKYIYPFKSSSSYREGVFKCGVRIGIDL